MKRKVAYICAFKYKSAQKKGWYEYYRHVCDALETLGFDLCKSKFFNIGRDYPLIDHDSTEYVYIYNHTCVDELKKRGFTFGKRTIILKPTGPNSKSFTLDTEGYAASSQITYEKPDYESTTDEEVDEFFNGYVKKCKESKEHKWSTSKMMSFEKLGVQLPEEYILILGQMPQDTTVRNFSFGDHWEKINLIIESIKHKKQIVVKLHPFLLPLKTDEENKTAMNEQVGKFQRGCYLNDIEKWKKYGITVLSGRESIHDVLLNAKVAILENSTAGIDCMMYDVPIISYGYPEYHWITKDIRHLTQLSNAIDDLSWFDINNSRRWLTWYCTKYQCYDYPSTKRRLIEILS